MYNKKVLIDSIKKLGSATSPPKKKDMIIDPRGQWAHPGQNTRIPSNNITMDAVPYPVYGDPNVGSSRMMYPEQEYNFPGADYVDEYPQINSKPLLKNQYGGELPKFQEKGAVQLLSKGYDLLSKVTRSNYNPLSIPIKKIGYKIASQHAGYDRSKQEVLDALSGKSKSRYFGQGMGLIEKGASTYGHGGRDLNKLYFFGDETGFLPVNYDFSSDPGLDALVKKYGPLKAFLLNSEVGHGEPISAFSLNTADILTDVGIGGGKGFYEPLLNFKFPMIQGWGPEASPQFYLPDGSLNLDLLSKGDIRYADPRQILETINHPELQTQVGYLKDRARTRFNTLFDEAGTDIIPFEINAGGKVLPDFQFETNPVRPFDNVAGHMAFLKRLPNKEFELTSRDIWGFSPSYDEKWGMTTAFQQAQRKAMEMFGKPFVLTQTNPIKFRKGGDSTNDNLSVKQSNIEGADKGLFSNQGFRKDQVIGLAHSNGEPVGHIGKMHNHSDEPNMYSIKKGNQRYVYAKRDIQPGEELTTDYRQQPELEQPEDFMRKGGSAPRLPRKKNSRGYSRSFEATNKLFAENSFFAKQRSRKNKIYDPRAQYFDNGGISKLEGDLISKVIMNRNRGVDFVDRAYALGDNPGTPMFNLPDDEQFGQNMSHKMAWGDDDNGQAWMYPTIMNPNNEAIPVPNQYADYISSEGYKNATGMNQYKEGGLQNFSPCEPDEYWDGTKCVKIPKGVTVITDPEKYKKLSKRYNDELFMYNSTYNLLDAIKKNKKNIGTYQRINLRYGNQPLIQSQKADWEQYKGVDWSKYDNIYPLYNKTHTQTLPGNSSHQPWRVDYYKKPNKIILGYIKKEPIITKKPVVEEEPIVIKKPVVEEFIPMPIKKPELIDTTTGDIIGQSEQLLAPEYSPSYPENRIGYDKYNWNSGKQVGMGTKWTLPKRQPKTGGFYNKMSKKVEDIKNYMEGYEDEDGNYIPGEIEKAQQEGRQINFQGNVSKTDKEAQEAYTQEYDEYKNLKNYQNQIMNLMQYKLNKKQFGGPLNKFVGGGPNDCPNNMTWDAELQECVTNAPLNPNEEPITTYQFESMTPDQIYARDGENRIKEQSNWTDEQWDVFEKAEKIKAEAEAKANAVIAYNKALVDEPKYAAEALDFVKGWHDSPMYNEMVLRSYNGQQKNADYLTKLRKKNIATIPPINIVDNQDAAGNGSILAQSDSMTGQIEVFPNGYGRGTSLYAHEDLHSSDRPRELYKFDHPSYTKYNKDGSPYTDFPSWMVYNDPRFPTENVWHDRVMPKSDQMYISKNRSSNWKDNENYKLAKEAGTYTPKTDEELKQEVINSGVSLDDPLFKENFNAAKKQNIEDVKWYQDYDKKQWKEFGHDYVSDPTETRARLGEIRSFAKDEGIYDPYTEKITPEIFQNYIYKQREPDNKQIRPINDLRYEFTDEEILYMLQNISKNSNPQKEEEGAEGVMKYGGLHKFLGGGGNPTCEKPYVWNPETNRCEKKTGCPNNFHLDLKSGRCISNYQKEGKATIKVKPKGTNTYVTATPDQLTAPYDNFWPEDLNLEEIANPVYFPEAQTELNVTYPNQKNKYDDNLKDLATIRKYPDLNYKVVIDPSKPEGFNKNENIYYVKSENTHQARKYKEWVQLKTLEKQNIQKLKDAGFNVDESDDKPFMLPNVSSDYYTYPEPVVDADGNTHFGSREYKEGWDYKKLTDLERPPQEYYNDPEYLGHVPQNVSFEDFYKGRPGTSMEDYTSRCKDCSYSHGINYKVDDDYLYRNINLSNVDESNEDDYEIEKDLEYEYADPSIESMYPKLEFEEGVDRPDYYSSDYDMKIPTIGIGTGETKSKKHTKRLFNGKGQKYSWTSYSPTKDLEFGTREATRLIPRMVQKATGYDRNFMEGYEDKEGNYFPGEIEKAEEEGRQINFKGASSLRDRKQQKIYNEKWKNSEEENKLIRQQNEDLLKEYGLNREEYVKLYGDFKNGGISLQLTKDNIQKYVDGGYIVEEIEDGGDPDPLDPHQSFLKNWYENRVFPKEMQKAKPILLNQLEQSFPPYVPTDALPTNVAAAYNYDDNIVELNKNYSAELQESSKTHENNHYLTQDANEYLDKPHTNLIEQNIINPKDINTGNKEWDKAYKENFDEIVSPEEMHSRIMTLRELAGFKPDQVITEQDVEDYFESVGDKLDPDIQDIKQVTKGNKAIVELLNYMASNNSNEDLNVAKYGGTTDYELGEEIDEATMKKLKKLGYTFEII